MPRRRGKSLAKRSRSTSPAGQQRAHPLGDELGARGGAERERLRPGVHVERGSVTSALTRSASPTPPPRAARCAPGTRRAGSRASVVLPEPSSPSSVMSFPAAGIDRLASQACLSPSSFPPPWHTPTRGRCSARPLPEGTRSHAHPHGRPAPASARRPWPSLPSCSPKARGTRVTPPAVRLLYTPTTWVRVPAGARRRCVRRRHRQTRGRGRDAHPVRVLAAGVRHRARRDDERRHGQPLAQDARGAAAVRHLVLLTDRPCDVLAMIRSRRQPVRFEAPGPSRFRLSA